MKIGNLDINKIYLGTNDNVKVYLGDTMLYPTSSTPSYFAFKVTVGGDIIWSGSTTANTLSYSKDNGSTWTTANSADTISVNSGETILWKGTPTPQTSKGIGRFSGDTNVRYSVEGNAMSLLYGDNFQGQTSLSGKDYALYGLFSGNTNVTSAENLSLPATTLADYCYNSMFWNCTSLTTAPELPATTLANYCYLSMFRGCKSLTTAPELPATALTNNCYRDMFWNCTSLTTAPELPATTLADYCYRAMFWGCTSLTTAPQLLATTLAVGCYYQMFQGCTNLTTAPELPSTTLIDLCYYGMFNGCTSLTTAPQLLATTLANDCYHSMFQGCTSLTTAPQLPSTTLAVGCYAGMFQDCTSLTTAPELPATTLANNCYSQMFEGCTNLTTAPKLLATTLANYCYEYMFLNCTSLNSITCFATDISASNCTNGWVYGVAASGTFTKAKNMSSWTTGDNGIPSGWSVQQSTPDYFTFKVTASGDIIWSGSTADNTLSYSKDNGSTWTTANSADTITVNSGETILWKGTPTPYLNIGIGRFSGDTNVRYSVEGNVMSLLYGDDFSDKTSLSGKTYAFFRLFSGNTNVTSAEHMVLPATTLANDCYHSMFQGCTSLTTAPELLATTLADYCCSDMFRDCTSLTEAPQLPATTLANNCYRNMFNGCTSLTTAPKLLATTLVNSCYYQMFQNCTSLNSITCLATNISASNCLTNWVSGVAASGTFIKAENMSSWTTGNSGIPNGWTVKEPTLDYFAFKVTVGGDIKWSGSTIDNSLSYSKDDGSTWTTVNSADTISVNSGETILWKGTPTPQSSKGIGRFSGDTNVRYSVEGNAMSLLFGDEFQEQTSLSGKDYALYGLFSGNTNVTSAENLSLPATTLANYCYRSMFQGCTNLTTAPELLATTLTNYCYYQMFRGCTSLTTAPELLATTLVSNCYYQMFSGCTSLNSITCLATYISASSCTNSWVKGVAVSGTFTKDANMGGWTSGTNGIPIGWTVVDAA